MTYQLTDTNTILRTEDGALIPADPANIDYANYLVWRDGTVEDVVDAETGEVTGTVIVGSHTPEPADLPVIAIPKEVTRFQALAALHFAGYLSSAEAAVAQGDVMTKLAWDNAQSFERSSPTLAALAGALGITDTQLDELFIAASKIKA